MERESRSAELERKVTGMWEGKRVWEGKGVWDGEAGGMARCGVRGVLCEMLCGGASTGRRADGLMQ